MMTERKLTVTLTQTRHLKPLIVIESSIGNGYEVTSPVLRGLANALLKAADDADKRPMAAKSFRAVKAEYEIDEDPQRAD